MRTNEKQPEVADIFRRYGPDYRHNNLLASEQSKAMHHIETCRTAKLGGHTDVCDHCGFEQNSYNSCRDRHCPKWQTLVKEKWLNDRKAELLPCPYFHNVFTLPHELNPLVLINKKVMLAILFAAVKETLQAFAGDPQWKLVGQLGFISTCIALSRQASFRLTKKDGLLPKINTSSGFNPWRKNSKEDICTSSKRPMIKKSYVFMGGVLPLQTSKASCY